MKLTVRGDTAGRSKVPEIITRAAKYLEKMPDGELMTTITLMNELGRLGSSGVSGWHPTLKDFREPDPRKRNQFLYGNKKTISELRRVGKL